MAFDPNAPRKPFVARGSRVVRCEACLMPQQRCLCADKPAIAGQAVFWLLTHRNEIYKPTNTGRLIVDTLQGSQVFIWSRNEPDAALREALADPRFAPCLVFPRGDDYQHRMVTPAQLPSDKIPAFIILDGTWRQARRIFRKSRYLDHLPVLEPQINAPSRYHLRQPTEDHHVCTAEVGAAVLREMGDQHSADVLDAYFDLFNSEYYAARRHKDLDNAAAQARSALQQALAKTTLLSEPPA